MKWNIITDSSCDLLPPAEQAEEVRLSSVPFVISVGATDFVDDGQLDVPAMLEAMKQEPSASHTSCPSPQAWLEQFEGADCSIALTISSQLSGSWNSAMIARELALEQYPEKQIAVVDSRSTGPELVLCVEVIRALIEKGTDFAEVVRQAEAFFRQKRIMFALSSFDNLVKNGRMSKAAGFLARKLGMWGIGTGSEQGTIQVTGKTRGAAGAVSRLLDTMKAHGFSGGRVAISHCQNAPLAAMLKRRIQEEWADCQVQIFPTRGLCSYYAERGGLIVSY